MHGVDGDIIAIAEMDSFQRGVVLAQSKNGAIGKIRQAYEACSVKLGERGKSGDG